MNQPKIFLIDDNKTFLDLFAAMPEVKNFDLQSFDAPQKALDALTREPADLIITDIQMPDMNGIELFHKVRDFSPSTPVILITAFGSTAQAVEAVQQGAFHYFEKPLTNNLPLFWTTVREALAKSQMQLQLAALSRQQERGQKLPVDLIGRSQAIREVKEAIRMVADLPATVLISGETGTGKELAAQVIHNQSGKIKEAFFPISCSEFSPGILESELFGHERGAFTGAIEQRMGFFELAHQGTLFLDEIGDAPAALQAKLLRVIESKHFSRVGGNATIKSDFRLIAATNQDLEQAVAEKAFRSDLLYRINVYKIRMPPLRQRKEDVPLLATYYLAYFNQAYGRPAETFSEAALQALRAYNWPGNVRELINIVERAVIISQDPVITTSHLPFAEHNENQTLSNLNLAEMEKFYMELALRRTGGNKTQAAQLLGISRKTLIDKVKRFHLYNF